MSHELSVSETGKASMAYVGATPWHGLGQQLTPGADLDTWQHEAGLDWEAKLAVVRYDRAVLDVMSGNTTHLLTDKPDARVIYRSDTGDALSVVSDRYKPVQPREVIQFYRDLTEAHGFQLETAGALKGGKKIWALARTPLGKELRGGDAVNAYLLLATSFDGSMATQARLTSIRVVCNNTLGFATNNGRADVTVPHSTTFNADKVKLELQLGDAWAAFSDTADAMTNRIVTKEETVRLYLGAYYGLTSDADIEQFRRNERNDTSAEKLVTRLTDALFNSPGAALASARGTLWGALQAVTYDIDHTRPARSQENRLNASWFGPGDSVKQRAWEHAARLVA